MLSGGHSLSQLPTFHRSAVREIYYNKIIPLRYIAIKLLYECKNLLAVVINLLIFVVNDTRIINEVMMQLEKDYADELCD